MEEESRAGKKLMKPTTNVHNPSLNQMKAVSRTSSVPSSPTSLIKSRSLRNACLCSPTTHVGSFRCRHHRNPGLMRNSMSVGAKLSELEANPSVGSREVGQVTHMTPCTE